MTMPTPLEAGLPLLERIASSTWRLRDGSWRVAAARTTDWIAHPDRIPPEALFKRGRRRLVFRLDSAHPQHPTVLAKAFTLDTLRHRWRHGRYARAEATHLLMATRRGLPAPRVVAHGWRRHRGLVCWNSVIMEFIEGQPLKEHLTQAADSSKRALLWRVLPLFQSVYETACNHIDLGPHAILLGKEREADCVIDFQSCQFLAMPSPTTFAAQAGYFGWCLTTQWNLVPRDLVLAWFRELTSRLSLQSQPEVERIFQHRLTHKASIRDRLARQRECHEPGARPPGRRLPGRRP